MLTTEYPNIKTVTLCLTEKCNLNCIYCYEHNKSNRVLDTELAKRILYDEITANDGFEQISVEYFGGEPFAAFRTLKNIHEYLISKPWRKRITAFTTTNGTLVTPEVKKWLIKHRDSLTCSLSLDGDRAVHNANRSNSFDKIDLSFFADNWPEQTVKMTISESSLPFLSDSVIFAHAKGFGVSCNLAYGIDWSDKNNFEILSNELHKLIAFYLAHPEIAPCSMLNLGIERLSRVNDTVSKWCGAGTHMHTYDVTGKRYPCQFFMPITIGDNMAKRAESLVFLENIPITLLDSECQKCPFVAACPNCCGYNYFSTGSLYLRDQNMCRLTRLMFVATAYFKFKQYENGLIAPDESQLYYLLNGISITQEWAKKHEMNVQK